MFSLETGPEEDPDPDLNSLLGLEEHPVWLHGTEEAETQKRIDILTLDVPARKYISVHEVFLVALPSPSQVLLLTSSAEIPVSAFCPSPSTIRSSSCEVLECDRLAGHDSV